MGHKGFRVIALSVYIIYFSVSLWTVAASASDLNNNIITNPGTDNGTSSDCELYSNCGLSEMSRTDSKIHKSGVATESYTTSQSVNPTDVATELYTTGQPVNATEDSINVSENLDSLDGIVPDETTLHQNGTTDNLNTINEDTEVTMNSVENSTDGTSTKPTTVTEIPDESSLSEPISDDIIIATDHYRTNIRDESSTTEINELDNGATGSKGKLNESVTDTLEIHGESVIDESLSNKEDNSLMSYFLNELTESITESSPNPQDDEEKISVTDSSYVDTPEEITPKSDEVTTPEDIRSETKIDFNTYDFTNVENYSKTPEEILLEKDVSSTEIDEVQDQPVNYHSSDDSGKDEGLKIVNIKTLNKQSADDLVEDLQNKKNKLEDIDSEKNEHVKRSQRRQSSLVFVFDATGSMYDDLVQLREGAELILQAMVERDDKPIKNYVLVPYRDPEIGVVTVTSDHTVFKDELEKIETYGGGNCPESALSGIRAALNVSLPYSYVYVFTDATATDYELVNEVINLVQQKQSQIVFVLTGDCNDRSKPHYKVYEQIAAASSGQIFHLQKSDVKQVLEYVKDSLANDRVNLNSIVNPPGDHKHKLAVDDTLKKVTVSVAGHSPKVSFTNPSGQLIDGPPKVVSLVDLLDVQVINLINPEPGDWTITVGSPEQHSVKVTGLSNITFTHGFSVHDPEGMDDTTMRPLQGTQNYLMISIDDEVELDKLTSAEFLDVSGDTLYEIPLQKVENDGQKGVLFKTDSILPPSDLFNIAINGLDKGGNPFRRISTTGIKAQEPEKPRLTVTPEMSGQYNDQITLRCKAESLVPVSVWWFRDGHPIMTKVDHIQSTVVEYMVSDLTEETEGSYVCKASNIAGHSAAQTNLVIVGQPPKVHLRPRNTTASPNATINLECLVESKLPITTQITFRNFTEIDSVLSQTAVEDVVVTYRGSRTVHTHSFVLSKHSQGIYSCVVSNRAGSVRMETSMKLLPPVKVKAIPKIVEFQKDGSLGFSCIVYETLNGRWLMQNNDIESNEDNSLDWEVTHVPIDDNGGIQLFLDVKHPNKKHEGFYDCYGFRDNETVFDTVEARYVEAPSINMEHTSLLFELDSIAVIDCEAGGVPQPFIFWYGLDGNQIVSEDGIMKRIHVNDLNQLVIHNVNPIDNGKYSCKAENQFGMTKGDIEITVFQKPYFTDIPEDQVINIYTSTVLTCKADGIPKPKVTWYFNDMPYNEVELADSGINLHLRNVEMKHNGKYSCIAENEYDTIKKDVFIDVVGLEAPVIHKGNRTVVLSEGDSYKFVCRFIRGKPYPKLFWRKNGLKIWDDIFDSLGASTEDDPSGGEGSNLELIINNIMREQEGNYSCIGRNIVGEDRYDFTLEVHSPPKFSSSKSDDEDYDYEDTRLILKPLEVIAGDDMTLNCGVQGKPKPLITWSKDGIPVVYTNIVHMDDNSSLVVLQVRETDGGLYTCFASNPAGTLNKNFTVDVLVRPTILNGSIIDPVIQTVEGQLVILPCGVHAVPSPQVVWMYNDQPIPFSNRMQMDSDNTLRFVANATDAGVYRCEASNKAGNTSKEYLVLVFVPPYIYPSGNEVIKTKENAEITLECNAIGFPVPTIRWIRNGQMLSNESSDYVFNDSGRLNITTMSRNTTGTFVCESENLAGLTEKLFHIIMNEAPNILPSEVPVNIQLLAGEEEFNIPCKASGNPVPYTTWLKNGRYIVNDMHVKVQTDGTLSLKLITEELNGKYTCQAANTEGSIEIDYTVQVIAPPVLLESEENSKTVVVREGSTAELDCPLRRTHVLPSIQWYKDSELIEQNVTSSKLTLLNVSRNDASEYSCLASNAGGRVSATFKLVVQWPPVFFGNVTEQNEYLHLIEGEPMKLACHVDANPAADVQWLRNLEMIGDISPIFRKNDIKTHHAGEHMCIASNPLGQIKKKFVIHVSAPPAIEGPSSVDVEVRLGQPVKLDCFATGYPKPNIEWSTKYPPDWDMIGDGRILKAFNISSYSEGVYVCKATNKAGKAEKYFNVTVLEPPKIPTVLINDTKMESPLISLPVGSNITISCHSSGHPPSTVLWVRNGMILNKDLESVNKSDLHLNNVQMQDTGKYTCLTKNKVGSEEFDITIDVLVIPEILNDISNDVYIIHKNDSKQRWKKIETLELQSVKLQCRTFGNPLPDIYWFKNNKYLGFYDSNMITEDHGQLLTIRRVSREHRGNYTCVARNKVGEDKMYFNLDVWVSPFVEQQKDGGQAYVANKGQNIYLECPVTSNPAPRIRWLKSPYSEIIGDDKNARYLLRDDNSTLVIHNVTISDNGNYSCIATNIAGMVEITFSVEVVEPPEFVEDIQDVKKPNVYPNGTIVTKLRRSFQLVCNVVAYPEPDVVWYKDGFRLHKTFTGDSLHISSDGKFLNVMDAQLNNAGKYTCNAYNKVGNVEKQFNVKVLVPAEWGTWSQWSECSETCGVGFNTRTRECQFHGDLEAVGGLSLRIVHHSAEQQDSKGIKISDEFLDKSACRGNFTEHRECFIMPCKVDGGWSPWGEWTSCSVLCGLGSRRRYRTCSSPRPQHGGKLCAGADAQQEPCAGLNCSKWFPWSAWTQCSVSCGTGIQSRVRKCDGPPDSCLGSPKEYIPCKLPDCPGKWGEWSDWGPCSVTCGSGVRRRHRECLGTNCTGGNLQIERCKDVPTSCNKFDKRFKNMQSVFIPSEKSPMKDVGFFNKNGKSYNDVTLNKQEYLPSVKFIVTPEVVSEQTYYKRPSSVPVNKLKKLNSGYESDIDDSGVQSATGDNQFHHRKMITAEDELVNVDVILDSDIPENIDTDNHSELVSYLHASEVAPLKMMEPPTVINTCSSGYTYDDENNKCKDINECQNSQNACHSTQLCENLPGSYECLCQRGYMSMGRGQRCLDINECLQNVHECSHDCINMAGTYRCACPVGLKLTTDNKTCVQDISQEVLYYSSTEMPRLYVATTVKPVPILYSPTISHNNEPSSEDENHLITRISPKRNKPLRRRRPHKHTFESDYDDYDVGKKNPKVSLSPVDDDEYADINEAEGRQRISKQTTWDVVTEATKDEEKDVYVSYESAKTEMPTSRDEIESIFNLNKESQSEVNVKSMPSLRRKHDKVNSKVTVFGKTNDDNNKGSNFSDEDSYEDEESTIFEDDCPDGYHLDREKCADINECAMNMHSCNGVTDACINTMGSHMCLPTPCPEKYKRNSERVCEQQCDERDIICSQGAALTQSVVYIVVSTSTQETKVPGAILSLQYGGVKDHMKYTLERQPKGETFFVTTDDKSGTIHTQMSPTFKRVNRIVVSGKTYDETDKKLLYYTKFVIYLYISD